MPDNQLICCNNLDWLKLQPDNLVQFTMGSPPYVDCRTYGIGFKLKGQAWVDWMIPQVVELCRVTDGLVFVNMAGKVKDFKYQPVVEWLVADLTRQHGIVCGPAPYVFARVGIPGSGGPHYHRRDWEPVYAFAKPESLPPKWSDNTSCGHPPKAPPGGQMSYRNADGQRKNASAGPKSHARWGDDPWRKRGRGNGIGGRKSNNEMKRGTMAGAALAERQEVQRSETSKAIANPGNIIRLHGGGGHLGDNRAHENEAPYPEKLVKFFVLNFAAPGSIVLDPWSGSGTTCAVAKKLGRNYIGLDIRESQITLSKRRLSEVQVELFQ